MSRSALGVVGTCTVGLVALWQLPLGAPPTDPAGWPAWWQQRDTIGAAADLARLGAGVWFGWVLLLSVAAVGADAAGAVRTAGLLRRRLPRTVARRLVGGMLVAATASAGTPVAATPADPPTAPLVLTDLGPAPVDPFALVALDPSPPPLPTAPAAAVHRSTWEVRPGEHLWGIASAHLAAQGAPTDDATVAAYWRRLINANRSVVGTQPDLIIAGQRLALPAIDGTLRGGS